MRGKGILYLIYILASNQIMMALPDVIEYFSPEGSEVIVSAVAWIILVATAENYLRPKILPGRKKNSLEYIVAVSLSVLISLVILRRIEGIYLAITRFLVVPILICVDFYFDYSPI